MKHPFVHLHCHTQYSLLDGAVRIDEMLDLAAGMGMPAAAITDHGNMFGAVQFYRAARERDLRPILGLETYVAPGSRFDRIPGRGQKSHHLLLLARNQTGYANLVKLTSRAFLEGFYYKPRVDRELLAEHSEGIIALSACLNGEVSRHLLAERYDDARSVAAFYRDLYDGQFYLELQDHGIPEEAVVNRRMLDLAGEMGLPLVATNDCHYLRQEHSAAHDVLLCIQTGKKRDDADRMHFSTDQMYFRSPEEMYSLFGHVEDALTNTVRIAEMCDVTMEFGRLKLPEFPLPQGFDDPDAYLGHLCRDGLTRLYPGASGEVVDRLQYELGIIRQMGYAGYFLIVQDFISYARSQGIPVGPGRGSAAGSLVAYALGITTIDPIRHSLLFERFLNPERVTMPDIDVDFSDRGRSRVIQYVVERYGADNVCQIITFGTMAARAVIRDVGRVLGMPYGDVDRIAKLVPAELGITLGRALDQSPDLKRAYNSDERVKELISIARVLEGLARHASTHAAGVVITPTPLTDNVPLFRTNDDEVTTQWDMGACEKVGLLKMDFLGLRTLTVLQDCLETLARRGIEMDLQNIPPDDPQTFELLARGDTVGIFQFESSGMAEYLRKLRPECLEDMIAMNALYRPGPLGSGMVEDFIERKHGRRKIEYEHALLEPILKETYGVIVYQEQVMQIASRLAGYSLGEADLLRRAMGKKKKEIMDEQRALFLRRALERKIPEAAARRIFDLMAHFSGYGFNKSHSAGYAIVAYQTAYLKVHYPVEFMAAAVTSEMSNSDRVMILLTEAKRMGIRVLPPDINLSDEQFTVDEAAIRFGLGAVKGVGHNAVDAIRAARAGGHFTDLFDFCERVDPGPVNRKCFEALIHAGAMDDLGPSRAMLLEGLPLAIEWGARRRAEKENGQGSLFGGVAEETARPLLPAADPWDPGEELRREKAALGFFVSAHPLDPWRSTLESLGCIRTQDLEGASDGRDLVLGGIPIHAKVSSDKKGRDMAFITVEDFTGTVECLAFADPFAECREVLTSDQPVLIKGRLSTREQEKPKILLEEAHLLEKLVEKGGLVVHIVVSTRWEEERLSRLYRLLGEHPGSCAVFLHVDPRMLGGVQMRLRSTRVRPGPDLCRGLQEIAGEAALRVTLGEYRGGRSADLYGDDLRRLEREAAGKKPSVAGSALGVAI